MPCSIGANHCRLRHLGWERCSHGLTSRPRESASELFLDELLSLFRDPPKSGRALLNGTLPLWYCAVRFAHSTPTWRLCLLMNSVLSFDPRVLKLQRHIGPSMLYTLGSSMRD